MVLELNEYVRTKDGYIGKCQKIDVYYGDILIRTELKRISYDFEVIKHSFNIIDLIEEGDYVNGEEVVKKEKHWLETSYNVIREDHIKSVLTKEQFKAMEYEVK